METDAGRKVQLPLLPHQVKPARSTNGLLSAFSMSSSSSSDSISFTWRAQCAFLQLTQLKTRSDSASILALQLVLVSSPRFAG